MPRSAASDLGLHCLHMSHKKDTRLIWVKNSKESYVNETRELKWPSIAHLNLRVSLFIASAANVHECNMSQSNHDRT